jgi:hypothetical protein
MGKKSGNRGKPDKFLIKEDKPKPTAIDLERDKLGSATEGVSVSLKYYRPQTECFSQWAADELKKFSGTLSKISQLEASKLMGYKPLCEAHKRAPAEDRFARPERLSEDLKFYEIKVDPSNAARVHGVFVGSVFFLVWLDRLHAVFPE